MSSLKFPLFAAVLALSACGNNALAPATTQSATAPAASASASSLEAQKQVVSKEEVEMAWMCRGIMTAVWAYNSSANAQMPAFAQGVTAEDDSFWTIRAANLTYEGITDEAENALIGGSVTLIVTPEAIEQRKADIEKCRAAKKAG
jgi:hypothetical protein